MSHHVHPTAGLRKHEYYGPLLYSYIDSILRSSELLEDDFQAILSVFHLEQFIINTTTNVPYSLIASAFSLLPSFVAAKKLGSLLYVVPCTFIVTGLTCYHIYEHKKIQKNEIVIEELIRHLKSIQVLNKRINKYLIERNSHSNKHGNVFFQPITNSINDFVKELSKQQSEFQRMIISNICNFSEYCQPLQEDCMLLKDFETSSLMNFVEDGLDNALRYTKDIIDLQQLLNSKLLSYFAIICCWEEQPITKKYLDGLINHKIPLLIRSVSNHYKNILEFFNSLRRAVIRLSERKLEKNSCMKVQFSGKLRQVVDSSVNNLCFVLEKLHNIIDLIERSDDEVDHKRIDEALIDLRGHTADTYEAIDILCKLHGILSENKQNDDPKTVPIYVDKREENDFPSLQSKTEIDPRDLIEDKERYELYLKATEEVEDSHPIYEETSNTQMRLMVKELKQNLKQHSFYLSAKKRWREDSDDYLSDGSSEEENSSIDGDTDHEITIKENPLFSSKRDETIVANKLKGPSNVNDSLKMQTTKTNRIETLENGTVSSVSENDISKIDTLTRAVENEEQDKWSPILQGIKAFSQNMNLNEETFGEEEDSD